MSGPFAQLGVASLLAGLLLWLLLRSYSENERLRADLVAKDAIIESKNEKLLNQTSEFSERLLRQAVDTAVEMTPLFRESLDLLRQAAVLFEVVKQSTDGRP